MVGNNFQSQNAFLPHGCCWIAPGDAARNRNASGILSFTTSPAWYRLRQAAPALFRKRAVLRSGSVRTLERRTMEPHVTAPTPSRAGGKWATSPAHYRRAPADRKNVTGERSYLLMPLRELALPRRSSVPLPVHPARRIVEERPEPNLPLRHAGLAAVPRAFGQPAPWDDSLMDEGPIRRQPRFIRSGSPTGGYRVNDRDRTPSRNRDHALASRKADPRGCFWGGGHCRFPASPE